MADTTKSSKVMVSIYGEDYPITGVTDPENITRLAEYVDAKMREAAENTRVAARDKVAILAAMSIASELQEEKDSSQYSGSRFNARVESIMARLDEALSYQP